MLPLRRFYTTETQSFRSPIVLDHLGANITYQRARSKTMGCGRSMLVGGPELPQEQPAEQTREHAHWQKEALPVAGHFQLSRLLALP
jgi:hypothetical protein